MKHCKLITYRSTTNSLIKQWRYGVGHVHHHLQKKKIQSITFNHFFLSLGKKQYRIRSIGWDYQIQINENFPWIWQRPIDVLNIKNFNWPKNKINNVHLITCREKEKKQQIILIFHWNHVKRKNAHKRFQNHNRLEEHTFSTFSELKNKLFSQV